MYTYNRKPRNLLHHYCRIPGIEHLLCGCEQPSCAHQAPALATAHREISAPACADDRGDTPLCLAAAKGDLDIVQSLITSGAAITQRNAREKSLLNAPFMMVAMSSSMLS